MNTDFNEEAVNWLKKKGFKEEEINDARNYLATIWKHMDAEKETTIKLPKDTSKKVASLVYSIALNSDYYGRPIGFLDNGLIAVTPGAKKIFEEEIKIGEYEEVLSKINKIKVGRTRSDPRSRTSVKKD